MSKTGRNEPCPCGSGKKYKRCCLEKTEMGNSVPIEKDSKQPEIMSLAKIPAKDLAALNDLVEEGYEDLKRQKQDRCCQKWLKAWKDYRKHLPLLLEFDHEDSNEMTPETELSISLFNWLQELSRVVSEYGLDEAKAKTCVNFCQEFLETFPDCDDLTRENTKRDLAEACFHLGLVNEGEKVLADLAAEFPCSVWPWISWGDMYSISRCQKYVLFDYEKAKGYYLKGLEADESEKDIVEERLEALDEEARKEGISIS